MDYRHLDEMVKKILKAKRYEHTLRVVETALKINETYGLDKSKVKIASLLHDYAKNYTIIQENNIIKKYNLEVDEFILVNRELIHSLLGAELAKIELRIEDDDILNAIRYHTTGRANMSLLEMIIYLADFCEPERKIANVHEVRLLSNTNIHKAMFVAQNISLDYLIKSNRPIDVRSIQCRNWLINKI